MTNHLMIIEGLVELFTKNATTILLIVLGLGCIVTVIESGNYVINRLMFAAIIVVCLWAFATENGELLLGTIVAYIGALFFASDRD